MLPCFRPQFRLRLIGLCALLIVIWSATASATEYHGQVFFGTVPVPGATVRVTQSDRKFTTVTDQQGLYQFTDLADGTWKIRIEMPGFVPLEGEATVGPGAQQGEWKLKLLDLGQMMAALVPATPSASPLQGQVLSPGDASAKNAPAATATTAPSQSPQDFSQQSADDGLLINGSVNNAATSKYNLSPAFGNRRPGVKSLYTGGIGAIAGNSIFDARPYSLSGLSLPKAYYSGLTGLATLGGPLNIPHLLYHGPNFFVAYERTRVRDASTATGLVPTAAERSGDLSGLMNPLGQPITIFDPAEGELLTGPIPVTSQAQALLKLYPLPNVAGNTLYNYETNVLSNTHVDVMQLRLDKAIGHRDQFYGGFAIQSTRADNANLFNFRDQTDTLGIDTKINWSHLFRHRYLMTLGYHFTRLRVRVTPEFANQSNVSGNAGIAGNDQDPANWGPPTLLFSSGFASLSDGQNSFNRNRTDAVSLSVSENHRRHTITVGGDYREQEFNQFGQQNPRGTFTFTGAATSGLAHINTSTSGSDFADFLLGIADAGALAYGNPDKYFREPVYDAYATDDFRVRPTFSINAGVRWEYGAPITELFGRLVNLDVAQDFSAVAPVLGSSPTGTLTGQRYPDSLVRPDKGIIEPRVGIAWRPLPASTLVVRAGYGIYSDTSVYLTMAEMMAQQGPLSINGNVPNSGNCILTLADGFRNCVGSKSTTFGVDPNFRVGYAQIWQLSMQRDLPGAMVMTATYMGIKGTHGMQEFLPNTFPVGAANPCPSCPAGFEYMTSGGNSTRESGEVELRRRLRRGLTAKLDYTFAKAIDDDSQVGAQGSQAAGGQSNQQQDESAPTASAPTAPPTIAQDWLNLRGERGLSTFDQRHLVSAQLQYTTGMGLRGGTLLGGWRGTLAKEWTVLARVSAGTGFPQSPIFLTAVPGTGFTGTVRPDVTGAPIYETASGRFLNPAAYAAPATGQWGNAGRNSITGPNQFNLDASFARTFRLRTKYNFDVRLDATNVLNHPVYTAWNTTVNSTTFGLPAAVNPMRSMQLTGRLRF